MENVYILGGAQTDFERNWSKEGKSCFAMVREVMDDCLSATGLTLEEIDRLKWENRVAAFIGNFAGGQFTGQNHTGPILTEISPAFCGVPSARYEAACASGSVALDAAITKLRLGRCDVAIVVGWEQMKAVPSLKCGDILGTAALYEAECAGIDFPFPNLFGSVAEKLIERYKLDRDRFLHDLALLSELNFRNARRNPNAQTRKWYMTLRKAEARYSETNPRVSGLLANTDCSQITDGAVAVVLVSERYLREKHLDLPAVRGTGMRVAPFRLEKKWAESEGSPWLLPWTRQAVVDACGEAGLRDADMDVFEVHDCFTSSEYLEISALGITEPGREYEAIEAGRLAIDGDRPVNPSGGLIGCGHPVGASGVRMFLDITKQVMGTAGDYQVAGAKNALMLNIGGSATTNCAFVVGWL